MALVEKQIIQRTVPEHQLAQPHRNPVLQRIFAARSVCCESELDYSLHNLLTYHTMSGIDAAAQLLAKHLCANHRIIIIADFDSDGASSCALAIRALKKMGAQHVSYLVPNRFDFGYGLSPEIVAIAASHAPHLLITVDNGIASIDGVKAAREHGIDVLITDHHLPGETLPQANAILNPNLPGDAFPSKSLAGVGVAFYLMLALRAHLKQHGWFDQTRSYPPLDDLLDLVALGTVADVVPLDYNNRILVAQGLKRIQKGQCCAGIKALASLSKRPLGSLLSSDIAFALAPRLNAAGRLEDMSIGIESLLTTDPNRAQQLAQTLDDLNQERRLIQTEMQQEAAAILGAMDLNDDPAAGLCLFQPDWHEGVIGILAGRLKEQLHRPVIVFARDRKKRLKGSARSVSGIHIRDVLADIAAAHPDLLYTFGGHAMAAGLSLPEDNFERFRDLFAAAVLQKRPQLAQQNIIYTDGALLSDELDLNLAEEIAAHSSWGQGFPAPQFSGLFRLLKRQVIADKHLKLIVQPTEGKKRRLSCIAFHTTDADWPSDLSRLLMVYYLEINEYHGQRELQLIVTHMQPASK